MMILMQRCVNVAVGARAGNDAANPPPLDLRVGRGGLRVVQIPAVAENVVFLNVHKVVDGVQVEVVDVPHVHVILDPWVGTSASVASRAANAAALTLSPIVEAGVIPGNVRRQPAVVQPWISAQHGVEGGPSLRGAFSERLHHCVG